MLVAKGEGEGVRSMIESFLKSLVMFYNLQKMASAFDRLTQTDSKWTVFNSILDFALIPHQYYPGGEELAAAHQRLVTWPDKEIIVEFLTAMADLQPEGFGDPLGEFYMMHLSNGRLGQYFTPENICEMMAQMNISAESKPGQTVLDPACGSGRTLLAAAKINRYLHFYGADLDALCCKMALYNMLLNSLTGEIAHMNSLSNEFFRGYRFGTKLIDGYHYPYFVEFTDPEESRIWLRPPVKSADLLPPAIPHEDVQPAATSPAVSQSLVQGSLF